MKFMVISDSLDSVSVDRAAELLSVSKSGFYKWFQRSISPDSDPNLEIRIREVIQDIVIEFPGYSYRRVTIELQNRGFSVKEKMVRKFMKEDNLLCVKKRFRRQTTDSNHSEKIYPNLAKDLKITSINQLWVADITYIQLSKEFIFLAVIIDVFSRRCIGWEISRNIDTELTLDALRKAFRTRRGDNLKGLGRIRKSGFPPSLF